MPSPQPDDDDTFACHTCGVLIQGKSARQAFSNHCRIELDPPGHDAQLRYGWGVRLMGPIGPREAVAA